MKIALALAATVAGLGALLAGGSAPAGADDQGDRPNILIIVADDQRSGTLDSMPQTREMFSDEGITYSNAYATTPLCCPSRASILSGQYTHNHGVVRNGDTDTLNYRRTFPAVLDDLGYRTAMFGKLSNAWQPGERPPIFDRVEIKWPDPTYAEDYLAERASEFIAEGEESDEEPWLLWLGARAPHTPFLPDPEHEDALVPAPITPGQLETDLSDKPPFVQGEVLDPRRTTGAEFDFRHSGAKEAFEIASRRDLLSLDDMVGDVFSALGEAGEADDTLAFYISDNGYMAGEHGGLARKHLPYMESVHVPMMMRWPGRVPADRGSTKLVANLDIAPTIYDALGVDPRYPVDGRSMLSDYQRSYLHTERLVGGNWPRFAGILTRKLHYIESLGPDTDTPRAQELYNLEQDPFELENVAAGDPSGAEDELAELHELARFARACRGALCP